MVTIGSFVLQSGHVSEGKAISMLLHVSYGIVFQLKPLALITCPWYFLILIPKWIVAKIRAVTFMTFKLPKCLEKCHPMNTKNDVFKFINMKLKCHLVTKKIMNIWIRHVQTTILKIVHVFSLKDLLIYVFHILVCFQSVLVNREIVNRGAVRWTEKMP